MSTQSSSSSTRTAADRRAATIEKVRQFYQPGRRDPQIASRKARFDAVVAIARKHGGAWVVSIPGSSEVTVEMLPGSSFRHELSDIGFKLVPADPPTGERIIPGRIVAPVLTEGSTLPIMIEHAGICRVQRWRFSLS